jgi:hypothetical protein
MHIPCFIRYLRIGISTIFLLDDSLYLPKYPGGIHSRFIFIFTLISWVVLLLESSPNITYLDLVLLTGVLPVFSLQSDNAIWCKWLFIVIFHMRRSLEQSLTSRVPRRPLFPPTRSILPRSSPTSFLRIPTPSRRKQAQSCNSTSAKAFPGISIDIDINSLKPSWVHAQAVDSLCQSWSWGVW